MADTNSLIRFRFGTFQSIKDLSSKNQTDIYFASDSPTFYNAGLWYGVSSLTSSVNEETGEVTLTINGGLGEDWKDSQPVCKFVAGMTTEQKDNLKMVVDFVNSITTTEGEDTQTVIDKWNEIINFLEGFKDTDVLLDRIVTLETNVTNLQNTTINAGDGLKGGGNLTGNRTIALGTPSTITDSSTNSVTTDSHTHAIDEASTEQRGIVRLNDSLTSTSTDQALTAKQGNVLDGKVNSITDLVNDMFEKVTDNGKTYIKTKYGFASDKFVSAGGTDDTESGGSGGVNLTQMWESLQNNNDTFKDRLINVAHIPTLTTGKISDFVSATQAIANTAANTAVANKADKSTTLAGYGITDAVNTNSGQYVNGTKYFKDITYSVRFSAFVKDSNDNVKTGYSSQFYRKMSGDVDNGTQILHVTNDIYIGFNIRDNNIYINDNGAYKHIYSTEKGLIADRLGAKSASDFVDLTSVQTIGGIKTFSNLIYQDTDIAGTNAWSRGIFLRCEKNIIGAIGAYGSNSSTLSHLYLGWGASPAIAANNLSVGENKFTYKGNTIYHVGNLSPVTTDTEQTITGVKTFSNLRVNNSTLVTNLNAEMVDGKHASDFLQITGGTLTGALKIVDANLSYDLGTLIVDKSLKAIGTMSATQGEFANYIKIGNATISWNAQGGYLEINEGLASQKFISAGGVVTGNAGGGSGGLSLTDMWVSLNGNIDAYGQSKIHIDHIPLDVILSHDSYENDVANRINRFNFSESSTFTNAVKSLIVADNIPTLPMSKISMLEDTLGNISTVVQSNYDTLNTRISELQSDHEARIQALEQALTWQTV